MKKTPFSLTALAVASVLLALGCEDDDEGSGGSGNIAEEMNRNLVVCVGDSITQGYACDGAPYPAQLAAITGKQVVNKGVGGVTAEAAPSAVRSAIAQKPAYICILYGSNDAIAGRDPAISAGQIQAAIAACKEAGIKPIVGTPPPMRDGHALFNGGAKGIAEAIRNVASSEGAACVDLYGAFGDGTGLLVPDGLHPNAAGAQLIAQKFAGAL